MSSLGIEKPSLPNRTGGSISRVTPWGGLELEKRGRAKFAFPRSPPERVLIQCQLSSRGWPTLRDGTRDGEKLRNFEMGQYSTDAC